MEGIGGRKMKGGNEVKYNLVENLKIKNQKNKQRAIFFLTFHSADKVHRPWRPERRQAKNIC